MFEFLRHPGNLPQWAHAFKSADDERARLETPAGAVDVHLRTSADAGGRHRGLTEEVKIGCTLGMLQCLDRPPRLAYVLGVILEMPGLEAAEILEVTCDVFRKRLQRARAAIISFTRAYCGLASDAAACACNCLVPAAQRVGRIRADSFDFAANASSFQEARAIIRQVDEARWAYEVHRTSHPRDSSVDFARRLARALDASHD